MTNEEQEAFNLMNKFGENASDVVDIVIQNIEATKLYLKECESVLTSPNVIELINEQIEEYAEKI